MKNLPPIDPAYLKPWFAKGNKFHVPDRKKDGFQAPKKSAGFFAIFSIFLSMSWWEVPYISIYG
ncbi:MAG: hypothetical protein ACJAY7_001173 [Pseudohongiellaceae bacterium]|jgi:hypothetical protein